MTDIDKNSARAPFAAKPAGRGSSKFRGVSAREFPSRTRYRATISARGQERHIGWFDTEREAAEAFDKAAVSFGLLDRQNFPREAKA